MNWTKLIVVVATLISTATISTPALAGDNKGYSGGSCKPINSGTTGLFYGDNATNLTRVTPNPVDTKVVCPVGQDNSTVPVRVPNALY